MTHRLPLLVALCAASACTTEVHNTYVTQVYGDTDVDADTDDTDTDTDAPGSSKPACDTVVALPDLALDLWGEDGHAFHLEVAPDQRTLGDDQACDGGGGGPVYDWDDAGPPCPLSAVNVRIVPAGQTAGAVTCADTGQVELEPVGQSSFRPWSEIPNFKLDVGEFIDQKFPTGDKQVRLNNGQADSTIVREAIGLAIWRALDYPAPRTRFVHTTSNVWDAEVHVGAWAAHVMVQPYKSAFFKASLPTAVHVWEGAGDPFAGSWWDVECQWTDEDDCDDAALDAIVRTVADAPKGDGFMDATSAVIDWPSVHRNQCLSALTGTGDDWIHNSNNVVIALRDDGKIQYLPYSVDINGGHPWYPETPYDGGAELTSRCADDAACRDAALTVCEDMVEAFDALDVPTTVVDERCDALVDAGLDRRADEAACAQIRDFYAARADELRAELAWLRAGGGGDTGDSGGPILPR